MSSEHTRPGADDGKDAGASTVELMIWFPGLLLIVVMILQVFGYVWARESAQSAARYGAHHARQFGAADRAGVQHAEDYLDQVAGSLVQNPRVTLTRTTNEVTLTITARPRQIPLPALHMPDFTVRARGPIEQFRPRP